MALRDYLAEEVAEDWVDGLITRREAVGRLMLLGFSGGAAGAPLAACAAAASPSPSASPRPSVAATVAPTAPTTAPTAALTPSAPAASAPAASAPAPVAGEAITFPGPRGEVQGFFAPATQPRGG